jgi:two-component system NtrC family sensor kinase
MKSRSKVSREPAKARSPNAARPSSTARQETEVVRLARELNEALERQTATLDVLQIISRSPDDLQPVFQSMLKNAVRLCDARFGNIYRWDGDALHLVATENAPIAFAQARGRSPLRPGPETPLGA